MEKGKNALLYKNKKLLRQIQWLAVIAGGICYSLGERQKETLMIRIMSGIIAGVVVGLPSLLCFRLTFDERKKKGPFFYSSKLFLELMNGCTYPQAAIIVITFLGLLGCAVLTFTSIGGYHYMYFVICWLCFTISYGIGLGVYLYKNREVPPDYLPPIDEEDEE